MKIIESAKEWRNNLQKKRHNASTDSPTITVRESAPIAFKLNETG